MHAVIDILLYQPIIFSKAIISVNFMKAKFYIRSK